MEHRTGDGDICGTERRGEKAVGEPASRKDLPKKKKISEQDITKEPMEGQISSFRSTWAQEMEQELTRDGQMSEFS